MQIGRYEVVSPLGAGGMSEVLLARSQQSGQLVVLKRQHHENEDAALVDEARVGLRLNHPSIVETLDLFYHEERPVLVVAYVPGATLASLRRVQPLPVQMCCRVGKEISEALDCIHSAREEDGTPLEMLHRDVTPANIMVGDDGHARLIDLGIARSAVNQADRTKEGMLKGTLRYLAPELLQKGIYTRATDLWALGLSLWEAALGRAAVDGDDIAVYRKICDGQVMALRPGETVDPRLRHAVGQLLSLAPECRPTSADAAALVFNQYLSMFNDTDAVCRAHVAAIHEESGASEAAEAAEAAEAFDEDVSRTHEAQILEGNVTEMIAGGLLHQGLRDQPSSQDTPPPVIFGDEAATPRPTEVLEAPRPWSPRPLASDLDPPGMSLPDLGPPGTALVSPDQILADLEADDFDRSDGGDAVHPFTPSLDEASAEDASAKDAPPSSDENAVAPSFAGGSPFPAGTFDPERTEVIEVDALKAKERADDVARRLGLRKKPDDDT